MIIGICGSGRRNGNTAKAVQAILEESGQEYELITLGDKKISGCIGCTACAKNNECVIQDDFISISRKLLESDAIVFGAPNYFNMLNGLSHVFWERTFCFRHREQFPLAGKLGVAITTGYNANTNEDPVLNAITKFMQENMMSIIGKVSVKGYSQCFSCGYGESCGAGNIVRTYGFIDEIQPCHLPPTFDEQPNSVSEAKRIGKILGSILNARK